MTGDAQRELAEDKARLMWLCETGRTRLEAAGEDASNFSHALELLKGGEFSIEKKKECGELARILYSHMGAVLSAPNWQSPSFWHTRVSQAGREEGKISASENDYKRDMHRDEKHYGQAFVQAYVDHPWRLAPMAFPTSSGMSAVATALVHLQDKVGQQGTVLAGTSSYFQNKWQLEKLFPGRVRYVDEFDTEGIVALADELQPAIIFLDSLCGAESLPMPNLNALVPALSKVLSNKSTLVLDNTGLATSYQPLKDLPLNPLGMRLVVVESLLKFHQFGFDRVGGGVIWAPLGSHEGLFHARMHLGTIMPDASVLAMPEPNRAMFDTRLARIGRNAKLFAQLLNTGMKEGGLVERVIHPSLNQYQGFAWTNSAPFQGPFVTLAFKEGARDVKHYDAFVARVQNIAHERGVDIVGGTSFGFDTTRLYVTARYATNITEPFVRVSLGTETEEEIRHLGQIFIEALAL